MAELPAIPLEAWEPTRNTLHLWCQIVGKLKLASTHPLNHWWNVPLYVDVRGLTTRRLVRNGIAFRIDFDFLEHALRVSTDRGAERELELRDGLSVASFDSGVHEILAELGLDVELVEKPFETPVSAIPFREDERHASYDREYVQRFWRVLEWTDDVLSEFAGWFCGKQSPVHLFWHSFDLALTRFSGVRIVPPGDVDAVTREAYSHEAISFGFWPGDPRTRFPAFYSYTAPEPETLAEQPLQPRAASWEDGPYGGHLAVLPYDAVRAADDPRATLLAFLQSAYEAGTRAAGWDHDGLMSAWCPAPGELERLAGR